MDDYVDPDEFNKSEDERIERMLDDSWRAPWQNPEQEELHDEGTAELFAEQWATCFDLSPYDHAAMLWALRNQIQLQT